MTFADPPFFRISEKYERIAEAVSSIAADKPNSGTTAARRMGMHIFTHQAFNGSHFSTS
jgi:hypothetical protein